VSWGVLRRTPQTPRVLAEENFGSHAVRGANGG